MYEKVGEVQEELRTGEEDQMCLGESRGMNMIKRTSAKYSNN